MQTAEGSGPKESTAFAVSGGSVQSGRVTDKAENALLLIITGSEEIVCFILFVFVFFPLTLIQSSLRPPPRHSSSLNLHQGTKGKRDLHHFLADAVRVVHIQLFVKIAILLFGFGMLIALFVKAAILAGVSCQSFSKDGLLP